LDAEAKYIDIFIWLFNLHGHISRITISDFPGREVPERRHGLFRNREVENLHVLVTPVVVDHSAVPVLTRNSRLCQAKANSGVKKETYKCKKIWQRGKKIKQKHE